VNTLPLGKLPPDLLRELLAAAPTFDERILLGPAMGLDCAVIDLGERLLVFKSDPITFAGDEIGWYLVQVNANDIATTGATPRWLPLTALLPEGRTSPETVREIGWQVFAACAELGISVIGGHTEVTHGLDRPILAGTLIGEVPRDRLVTPRGARAGDRVLLTKGVPIEATAILAREFPARLQGILTETELAEARDYLYRPGISVLRDAQIALQAGRVTAMHDPTEGGLAAALWVLAEAANCSLVVDLAAVPIPPLAARICAAFSLDPLAAIASGALLLTVAEDDATHITESLREGGIACNQIGYVSAAPVAVWQDTPHGRVALPRPLRDEIGRVFMHEGASGNHA
jgi:hydrogenase maturation factor